MGAMISRLFIEEGKQTTKYSKYDGNLLQVRRQLTSSQTTTYFKYDDNLLKLRRQRIFTTLPSLLMVRELVDEIYFCLTFILTCYGCTTGDDRTNGSCHGGVAGFYA